MTDGAPGRRQATNGVPSAPRRSVAEIFADSRQGAANVAGVRFQIVVSGWLLAMGERLPSPLASATPEGLEDVDCVTIDGDEILVQVKERKDGQTTWPVSDMVAAIAHAAPALAAQPRARLAVITNARPGRDLAAGALDEPLTALMHDGTRLEEAARGASIPTEMLNRTSMVYAQAPVLVEEAVAALAADRRIAPAVAALVWARLLEKLQEMAGEQRSRSVEDAVRADRSLLDALAQQVQATVNPDALEEPVRRGLAEMLDFTTPSTIDAAQFLLGVDVRPGHIAADLDLIRPAEMQAVFAALARGPGTVLRGPSGSGKSALLWRCAYETAGKLRAVHLRRVADDDVETLVRWLLLLRPTARTPVLVCADDLGRPPMSGWPVLARRLADVPHVLVLGACREEDFSAELLGDALELVRLLLDERLAEDIAAQLDARGVPMRRSVEEAFADADGLLLEYVALLTTGERLEHVIGRQVDDRVAPERAVERDVLRLVTAAHTAGLGVGYDALAQLVDRDDELAQALGRLADELLVRVDDRQRWCGLHELRSTAAHNQLHTIPPPTEHDTFARLLTVFDGAEIAHLLRRQADRGVALAMLAEPLARRLRRADATAADVADALEASIDVDAIVHARACWQHTLDVGGPAGARDALLYAHAIRFADVPPSDSRAVNALGDSLPARTPSLACAVADALDADRMVELVGAAAPHVALRLVEALAVSDGPRLSDHQARQLLGACDPRDGHERARLHHAAWSLAGRPREPARVLGARNMLLDRLARDDDTVLAWTCEDDGDELTVALKLFSADGRLGPDLRRYLATVAMLCPDATHVALRVCTPRGEMMAAVPDDEHVHAPRPAAHVETRRTAAFARSLDRVRAADSLSERLDLQHGVITKLGALLVQARLQLLYPNVQSSPQRRWHAAVAGVQEQVGALPTLPPARRPEHPDAHDPISRRLVAVAVALDEIASDARGDVSEQRGVAALLREQLEPLEPAAGPLATQLDRDFRRLSPSIARLADALLAVADEPALEVAGAPDSDAADRAVAEALGRSRQRERTVLADALDGLATILHEIGGHDADDVLGPQWLVTVPFDQRDAAVWDRLGEIHGDPRNRLAFRVTVAPVDSGWVLAGQAWQIGRRGLYPADADRVQALCAEASLPVLDTPQLSSDLALAEEIVEASRLAAWAACRRAGRFPADRLLERLERQIELFERHAVEVARRVPPIANAPVLTRYIRREAAGATPVSLVAGDVLLRRYGDENGASMLLSMYRSGIAGVAARRAGRPPTKPS